jgi:ABC-type amino acid transport substrate-binding protein
MLSSSTRAARRTVRPGRALVPILMRTIPTLALALTAASLAACKRTPPQLGSDTSAARSDTNTSPAALAPIPKTGADTIAVPAAAVDTTTNRPAGQPSSTGAANKATGVDTPITQRMGSPSVKRPSP